MQFIGVIIIVLLLVYAPWNVVVWGSFALFVTFTFFWGLHDWKERKNGPSPDVEGIPVKARLKIIYKDQQGAVTEREIDVRSYNSHHGSISAFCRLRQEKRTFMLGSIKEAIDMDTGELLDVKKLRSHFRGAVVVMRRSDSID